MMNSHDDMEGQVGFADDDSRDAPQYSDERENLLAEWHHKSFQLQMTGRWFTDRGKNDKHPGLSLRDVWEKSHEPMEVTIGPNDRTLYLKLKAGAQPVLDKFFAHPEFASVKADFWNRQREADSLLRKLERIEKLAQRASYRGHTLAQIDLDDADSSYVLDKIIPAGEVSIVFGPPKAAKSAFLHKLAACVASDNLQFDGLKVAHGRVLYLTLDAGASEKRVKARLLPIYSRLNTPLNDNLILHDAPVYLDDADNIAALLEKYPGRFALVVIDSLYMALSGHDPARPEQVNRAFDSLKLIAEETGAAVVIAHHATRSDGKRPYGSIFLEAGASALCRMDRDMKTDEVTLDVQWLKNDDAPDAPLIFKLEGSYLASAADLKAMGLIDPIKTAPRGDMLALMPTEPGLPIAKARKLIEHLLNAPTKRAKDQEWNRARAAWESAGLVKQERGRIWRVQ